MRTLLVMSLALVAACSDPHGAPLDAPMPDASSIDPAQSRFLVDRNTAAVGTELVMVLVELRDQAGQPVVGARVTLTASGTDNAIVPLAPTDATGTATTTWSSTKAQVETLTATVDDGTMLGPQSVQFVAGPPAELRFDQQPLSVEAGAPLAPVVAIDDAYGNPTSATTPTITLALSVNPGTAVLAGTLTRPPAQGLAAFADVHIDVPASGYVLHATAPGLTAVDSAPFDILAGAASSMYSRLVVAPPFVAASGTAAAAITVDARNGHNVPISNATVALSASGAANVLTPMQGNADAMGRFTATWTSTAAGMKTLTATIGTLMLTASVTFYAPPCTPHVPGVPFAPADQGITAFALADIDGDGRLDALDAEPAASQLVVRPGHTDGTFLQAVKTPLAGQTVWLASGDLDADGHIDVVAARSDTSSATILLGKGDGSFNAPSSLALAAAASSIVLADFNSDGKLDIAATLPSQNQIAIHIGAGNGTFGAAATTLAVSFSPGLLEVGDINNDGRPDLLAGSNYGSPMGAFLATGNAAFGSQVTTNDGGRLRLVDVNHDNKLDVVLVDPSLGVRVRLGNGTGSFGALSQSLDPGVGFASLAVADFNGDTHPDIAVAAAPRLVIINGVGDGTFTLGSRYAINAFAAPSGPSSLATSDVEGDGRVDLVLAGAAIGTARNLGAAGFALPFVAAVDRTLLQVSADFNGDGYPDLIGHDYAGAFTLVALLANANGSLTRMSTGVGVSQQSDGATGDINEDGKQDLVAFDGPSFVARTLLGVGDGTFQVGPTSAIPYAQNGTLVDVNGDGHLDIVVISAGGVNVKLGTGTGTFGAAVLHATASEPFHLIARDLDGDGDVDFVTQSLPAIDVFLNNGTGGFNMPNHYTSAMNLTAATVGDFNGDGHPDIAYSDKEVHLLIGQGNGTFTASPNVFTLTSYPSLQIENMTAIDLDGTGTQDILVDTSRNFFVLQGLGNGTFAAPVNLGYGFVNGDTNGSPFVIADRNRDGVLDIAFSTSDGLAVALQGMCTP